MNKNLLKDSLIGNASYPIHNNTDENEFIRKLVDLIRSHSTSMKDIIEFFNDSYDGITIFRLIFASGYKWQANGFAAYGYSFA